MEKVTIKVKAPGSEADKECKEEKKEEKKAD
jgi:hypothetical protein